MIKKGTTKEGFYIEIVLSEKAKKEGKILGEIQDLLMEITDVNCQKYEATVTLCKGWTQEELQKIVTETCLMCDAAPKSIKSTFLGAPILN